MNLDSDACHRALAAKDARFDGLFFVGVSSTRIYCRPVCSARAPKRENCTFYSSAAMAENAGYRPCLICRPELAPGRSRIDATHRLATAAVRRIEDGALTETSLADLARELGFSDRHLRRVIQDTFGVTAVELAQTSRLLMAKRLLTDTDLAVGEVAMASGFGSLRRFNALFQTRYRLKPTELRKRRKPSVVDDAIVFEVGYRPPYDWDHMLEFLRVRAACGVEAVVGSAYVRTVAIGDRRGWIAVSPHPTRHSLRVEMTSVLAPVLPNVLRRVKRLFDTSAEPDHIALALGDVAAARPGLRVPGAFDGFEIAVRAILGQQVSVRGASTLAGRIAAAFGEAVETPYDELCRISPTPARLSTASESEICSHGIVGARARAIVGVARAVAGGELKLVPGADADATIAQLEAMPGLGSWTAQYVAMRALSWPDAFPHSDLGLRKALDEDDPACVLKIAECWRPWRAYAAMHLWSSL